MTELQDALHEIEDDGRWMTLGALSDDDLSDIEQDVGRLLPEGLKELLRETAGGSWAGQHIVQFFDADWLRSVNRAEPLSTDSGVWIFGEDAGPNYYVVDSDDTLGQGAGAVSVVPMGSTAPGTARRVAADVPSFVRWMVRQG